MVSFTFLHSDITQGSKFSVEDGNWCMTPYLATVEVKWVDDKDVYYTKQSSTLMKSTPIERFLEIVNKTNEKNQR